MFFRQSQNRAKIDLVQQPSTNSSIAPTMAPPSDSYAPEAFREVIDAVHLEQVIFSKVPAKFSVPTRQVRLAMRDLDAVNAIQIKSNQVYRWATKYANTPMPKDGSMHTEWELHQCILTGIGGKMKLKGAMEEFGISKFTQKTYADKLAKSFGFTTQKEVRQKHK
jgi:hypothetical protein